MAGQQPIGLGQRGLAGNARLIPAGLAKPVVSLARRRLSPMPTEQTNPVACSTARCTSAAHASGSPVRAPRTPSPTQHLDHDREPPQGHDPLGHCLIGRCVRRQEHRLRAPPVVDDRPRSSPGRSMTGSGTLVQPDRKAERTARRGTEGHLQPLGVRLRPARSSDDVINYYVRMFSTGTPCAAASGGTERSTRPSHRTRSARAGD